MKVVFWLVYLSAVLLGGFRPAFGQTVIPYTVQVLEFTGVEDLNDRQDFIRNRVINGSLVGEALLRKKKDQPTSISCGGDTFASEINNRAKVTGACTLTNVGERIGYGYIWDSQGIRSEERRVGK